MTSRLRGLIAAPYTPFDSNRAVNWPVIPRYVDYLHQNGFAAAFIAGTTGEGLSLSFDERLRLAEAWLAASRGRLAVLVQVGCTALGEATALAAHAQRQGAAGIACLAPGYFKPETLGQLIDWCRSVAAAASATPFYYYHMPGMNGVSFPMHDFLAAASEEIPSLAGLKYSFEDMADLGRCAAGFGERCDVVVGRDELLLEGLNAGARAAVGTTYNYAAPLFRRLMAAHAAGDQAEAERWQAAARRMIGICCRQGVSHLAASKSLMAGFGVDCGPVRQPLQAIAAGQALQLRDELKAAGWEDFICQTLPHG